MSGFRTYISDIIDSVLRPLGGCSGEIVAIVSIDVCELEAKRKKLLRWLVDADGRIEVMSDVYTEFTDKEPIVGKLIEDELGLRYIPMLTQDLTREVKSCARTHDYATLNTLGYKVVVLDPDTCS